VRTLIPLLAWICALFLVAAPALADEGMWTFDNFPLARVNHEYGLHLDQAWLDHLQHASVRLSVGCSASLVSGDGLVFSNHHCVMPCEQALTTAEHDTVATGFMATTRPDEKPCPGLSADILTDITDVTRQVKTSLTGLTGSAFLTVLNATQAGLEKTACGDEAKWHCEVVSLYQGGQYKLYKYRRYSDVRLVFAPEFQAAFFGGDPDNFNFPRYALDCSFLRLYDDGQPVSTPEHLIWNSEAPADGEPTFVAGNPGTTQRLLTASQLQTLHDLVLPLRLVTLSELRGRTIRFAEESEANRRNSQDFLFGLENGFKVYSGQQLALTDPALIPGKARDEAKLKARLPRGLRKTIGDPWADLTRIQVDYRRLYYPYYFAETALNASDLFEVAREIVRAAEERPKPSAERLPEYADSRLAALKHELNATPPIDKAMDAMILEQRLAKAREYLTVDSPLTKLMLSKESPQALAARLEAGTHLDDAKVRQALWDGGLPAVMASDDPMIRYALKIDAEARRLRAEFEAKVTGPTRIASTKIAQARFAVYGTAIYPDATFTLRLSYGKVAGWTYQGTTVAPFTYMKGLYDRATGQAPFDLAPHLAAAQGKYDEDTVFDYVTTNDITGGNSGSPVVNARGEVIGAAFDGNIHSIGGAFAYDGATNRTVVVSTAAITVALDKVYGDPALVGELTGK
jgi:hypothetical protein